MMLLPLLSLGILACSFPRDRVADHDSIADPTLGLVQASNETGLSSACSIFYRFIRHKVGFVY